MIKKLFATIAEQKKADRKAQLYQRLIQHEARIGGQLFGEVPSGGRREFFCLDRHTWVWHEEWVDKAGQRQIRTTRYDMRPDGVLKSQNGHYQRLSLQEASRLREAIKLYVPKVEAELYSFAA